MAVIAFRAIAAIATATAPFLPAIAQAQDTPEISVENLNGAMETFFGRGYDILLSVGHDDRDASKNWVVDRKVSGAKATQRCFLRLETPVIVRRRGIDNVDTQFGINWAKIRDIRRDGRVISFRAGYMKQGDWARLTIHDVDNAEMFEAVMGFMADECGG